MKEVSKILEDFPTPHEAPDDGELVTNLVVAKSAIADAQEKGLSPPYKWPAPALTLKNATRLNEALVSKGWKLAGNLIYALPKEAPSYGGVPASPPFDHFGHSPVGVHICPGCGKTCSTLHANCPNCLFYFSSGGFTHIPAGGGAKAL